MTEQQKDVADSLARFLAKQNARTTKPLDLAVCAEPGCNRRIDLKFMHCAWHAPVPSKKKEKTPIITGG